MNEPTGILKSQKRSIIFYTSDQDIHDWWEAIDNRDKSRTLCDLIKQSMNTHRSETINQRIERITGDLKAVLRDLPDLTPNALVIEFDLAHIALSPLIALLREQVPYLVLARGQYAFALTSSPSYSHLPRITLTQDICRLLVEDEAVKSFEYCN